MRSVLLVALVCIGIAPPQLRSQATRHDSAAAPSASSQLGQQLFSLNCSGCHGLDARGGEHGPNIATTAEVQRLSDRNIFRIVHDGISGTGMPAFRSRFDDAQLSAVVSYLHVLQGKHSGVAPSGNPERGRSLFFGKARCSECHMIGGDGGFIGSDLSGYGAQHSPDVARSAILDPDKNLDPHHRAVTVTTRDGRRFTGRALNEDNFSLQLQTLDGMFHFFEKPSLAHLEHEPRSLMPSNYRSTLSPGDLDDLVSYLTTAAVPQASGAGEENEE
ncbi:MAG: c-type cytochrome [Bryobacteraceae bacterium]